MKLIEEDVWTPPYPQKREGADLTKAKKAKPKLPGALDVKLAQKD